MKKIDKITEGAFFKMFNTVYYTERAQVESNKVIFQLMYQNDRGGNTYVGDVTVSKKSLRIIRQFGSITLQKSISLSAISFV